MRAVLTLSLLVSVSCAAMAQEAVRWNALAYGSQFKYFQEQQTQDKDSWAALAPEEQKQELEAVRDASLERQGQVVDYYNGAMERWDAEQLRGGLKDNKDRDIKTVSIWLGEERGSALERKLSTLRAMTLKAGQQGLDADDLAALEPYLKPEAIAGMKASKLAADSINRPGDAAKKKTGLDPSKSGKELWEFAGREPSKLSAGKFSKLYDGSNSTDKDSSQSADTVKLKAKKNSKFSAPGTEADVSKKRLTSSAPPELALAGKTKTQTGADLSMAYGGASKASTPAGAGRISVSNDAQRLKAKYGGADEALGKVMSARDEPANGAGSRKAELEAFLGHSLTQTDLRNLDHYLNSYGAITAQLPIKPTDGLQVRVLKKLGKEILAVGHVVVDVGYTGAKAFDQKTGLNVFGPLGRAAGCAECRFNDPSTSKAGFDEILYNVQGTYDGARSWH